jgi:ATP/maltotriose-dependent transcriptional regulator MalT
MKGNLAVFMARQGLLNADQRLLDDALQTASDNFAQGEKLDMLYSRFESRRTLAHVRLIRGEYDEAERLCAEALKLVSETESRVSRLWLGPLYIEVVLAVSKNFEMAAQAAEAAGKLDEAANKGAQASQKRVFAAELLARYTEFVAGCQSPRFKREAERLAILLQN